MGFSVLTSSFAFSPSSLIWIFSAPPDSAAVFSMVVKTPPSLKRG